MHEIKFLEKRDKKGLVKFTDLADPDYNPNHNGHVDYERGMRRMHAVLDTGEVISGEAVHCVGRLEDVDHREGGARGHLQEAEASKD